MRLDGVFYIGLKRKNGYSREQEVCIEFLFPPVTAPFSRYRLVERGILREKINQIDSILGSCIPNLTEQNPFLMTVDDAKRIIDLISETFDFEEEFGWNIKAFKASLEYLSKSSQNETQRNNVHCLVV